MQQLYVKTKDAGIKVVHILRSWQDISGQEVFLHADGTYGDRDGTPKKDAATFNIMPVEHRELALAWWQRKGEKLSRKHYQDKAAKMAQRAGDYQEKIAAQEMNSQLDAILYGRKNQLANGKFGAVEAAKPWMEHGFTKRPDWWGQAKVVEFKNCQYVMQEPTLQKEDEKNDPPAPDKEKKLNNEAIT